MRPVLVIGAGPAGLATAACLAKRRVPYRLVDRSGLAGGAYRVMYDGITLASPTSMTPLPGLAPLVGDLYSTVPMYRAYLERYVETHALVVERGSIESVARKGGVFEVVIDGAAHEAAAVVVATGMWDFPVTPALDADDGSIPSIHAKAWRGPAVHREEPIAIVGGATAAVEIAEELARAGRRVVVAARRGVKLVRQRLFGLDLQEWLTPIEHAPTWLGRSYCETHPTLPATDLGFSDFRARGLVDVRGAIVEIARGEIRFADGTNARADLLVFATGYRYDTPFVPPEVLRAKGGHLRAKHAESVSWPGLFVVGAPCAARFSSEFLRGVKKDAEDVAARIAARAS